MSDDNVLFLPIPPLETTPEWYVVMFPVSEVMQGRFTTEQLEQAATVAFFSQLALDPAASDGDGVVDEDISLQWINATIRYPADSFRKVIRVTARVQRTPKEG